jgi:signal transduction histidine kinase
MSTSITKYLLPSDLRDLIASLYKNIAFKLRLVFHPITVFVTTLALCITLIVLWVISYQNQSEVIDTLMNQTGFSSIDVDLPIILLVVGVVLLSSILVSTIVLFIYYAQKSIMFRQQQNFVSSVTHELRSPIASIQLAIETLNSRTLSPELNKRMHNMIQEDIERLKSLVERVLISNRFDQGFASFEETTPIDLMEFFTELTEKVKHLDSSAADRIQLNIQGPQVVYSSKDALVLIFTNLLENAIKYSPKGTPITVTTEVQNKNLIAEVKDLGIGLSKRDQAKIFKLFYRSPEHRRRAIKGTGIGLHIVNLAVRKLKGRINVFSSGKNLGSTFRVLIPIKKIRGE